MMQIYTAKCITYVLITGRVGVGGFVGEDVGGWLKMTVGSEEGNPRGTRAHCKHLPVF